MSAFGHVGRLRPRSILPAATVLVVSGMAAALVAPPPPAIGGRVAAALLASWGVSLFLPRPGLRRVFAALGLAAAGWFMMAMAVDRAPVPPGVVDRPCRIRGTVTGQPREFRGGIAATVRCAEFDCGTGTRPFGERILLSVYGESERLLGAGDTIRAETVLRVPPARRSPGGYDRRLALAGEGIGLVASVEEGPRLLVDRGSAPARLAAVNRFVARTSTLFAGLGQPADGLLHALILGRSHRLEPHVEEDFRRSGLVHVLSVSGLHVAIFGLASFAALVFLLRRVSALAERLDVRRPAALLSLLPMVFYTVVSGSQAPAVRSCVMAGAVAVAVAAGRSSLGINALSAAALALLALSPTSLASPSFQLSFVATLGILLAAGRHPSLFRPAEGPPGARLAGWVTCSLAVSAAAFLASAPLAARHFSLVAPAGIAATLASLPIFSWVVLPFGLVAGLMASLGLPAGWPAAAAAWGARLMADLAGWFSGLDLHVSGPTPTPLQVVALYLAMVAVFLGSSRRLRVATVALLTLALFLPGMMPEGKGMNVSVLDVGQGDASLVRVPGGGTILVDAGPRLGNSDRGRSVVLPALHAMGVRRLDLLVLSHPHPDHAGGAASVAAGIRVHMVTCPRGEEPAVRELLGPGGRDVTVRGLSRGDRLRVAGVDLEVFWPPAGELAAGDGNDRSLVVAVRYGGSSAIFPGDAGTDVLEGLARGDGSFLRADLLKVPHHGSAASLAPGFVTAVAPRLAVISAGRNAFGHPHPSVVKALGESGARVLVTATDGTAEVSLGPGSMSTLAWTGEVGGPSPGGIWRWFLRGY